MNHIIEKMKNAWNDLKNAFMNMSKMNRILLGVGSAASVVFVVAIVFVYALQTSAKEDTQMVASAGFHDGAVKVKEQLDMATTEVTTEESTEETDPEEIKVRLKLTSIERDLKVTFIDRATGKSVSKIPFEIEVTTPDGKKETWKDDDMDGIIRKKDITPGEYQVNAIPFLGEDGTPVEEYKHVILPEDVQKCTVKDKIAYQKVEIKDEIKTEAEVPASEIIPETNNTVVESKLVDTVEYVDTWSGPAYREVATDDIQKPGKTAKTNQFTSNKNRLAQAPLRAAMNNNSVVFLDANGQIINLDVAPIDNDEDNTTEVTTEATTEVTTEATTEATAEATTEAASTTASATTATTTQAPTTSAPTQTRPGENDTTNGLKTISGEQLYYFDGTEYKKAVVADYYKFDKFYVQYTKYTGWQMLNGNRYYYDKNGNPVTGEHIIQEVKYNFTDDGKQITGDGFLGVDVSKYNETIDWEKAKAAGVHFAIIRCAYRGGEIGNIVTDPYFHKNIKGATNAGIKVGVYFFSQAIDRVEAVEEASATLELVKNYKITYPIFIDVEDLYLKSGPARANANSKSTRTEICKAFCETIKASGYKAGIYANKYYFTEKINTSQLTQYTIWLAQYRTEPTYTATRYDMWQYTETGHIDGIGKVDLNISYLGY